MTEPLPSDLLAKMNAYWRAANYLSVSQIYLFDNPLLTTPLAIEHVKPRLLGHWGTTPGLNFIYVHLNRAVAERASACAHRPRPRCFVHTKQAHHPCVPRAIRG